jgi:outer membrane receptor protein involved in Fe transport
MKSSLAFGLACLACSVATANLIAQVVAPASANTANKTTDTPLQLSPFEVNTSKDTSYGALNSNSISAFNTELLKTPVAADIFTEEFMRDVGTTTVEDLLNGYGAGVGQATPTVQGDSGNLPGDRPLIGSSTSRGVTTGATRRNGFVMSPSTANTTDTFDTERVDVIKGANALLFGASGAGGFANTTSKQARFGRGGAPLSTATLSWRVDQYGSQRGMVDANYGLKNLALRLVVMNEELSYRRLFIGASTRAIYGTMSARLPFNTTVRLAVTQTDTNRITPLTIGSVSFTNATRDPRHSYALSYLIATNQTGAINPKTGAAYPGGAIANGAVNWTSAYSWGGWTEEEDTGSTNGILSTETVWTKWLATSVAAMYDFSPGWRSNNGGTDRAAHVQQCQSTRRMGQQFELFHQPHARRQQWPPARLPGQRRGDLRPVPRQGEDPVRLGLRLQFHPEREYQTPMRVIRYCGTTSFTTARPPAA